MQLDSMEQAAASFINQRKATTVLKGRSMCMFGAQYRVWSFRSSECFRQFVLWFLNMGDLNKGSNASLAYPVP